MNKSEKAANLMREHRLNCAQSVLGVFAKEYGLDRNLALKVAMGFGGGMGRTGMTCGAVTGAYMVLGLSQRINENNPRESIERAYKMVQEFNRQFEKMHGSILCKELINYDLNSPEELTEAREKGVFSTVCPNLVSDATVILESMLVTC
jgi:C_GCAxxG_C_C family probable redox protein